MCPVLGLPAADGADAAYAGRWAVVLDDGEIPEADAPEVQEVTLECRMGYLVLRAPGMLRLDVPLDVVEDDPSVVEELTLRSRTLRVVDEGEWASAWLTQVTGRSARLVKFVDSET